MRRGLGVFGGVAVVCALTACGYRHIDGPVVHGYASLSEVNTDSTEVVVGTPVKAAIGGAADEAGNSDLRAYLTTVKIDRVLRGPLGPGTEIILRQIAGPNEPTPAGYQLTDGAEYVFFLQPFTFGSGTAPTGQYVVTGGQGVYELSGSSVTVTTESASLAEGTETSLPPSVSLGQLINVAAATPSSTAGEN